MQLWARQNTIIMCKANSLLYFWHLYRRPLILTTNSGLWKGPCKLSSLTRLKLSHLKAVIVFEKMIVLIVLKWSWTKWFFSQTGYLERMHSVFCSSTVFSLHPISFNGVVCGFWKVSNAQEHLQLKWQILWLCLIMLSKLTHIDANNSVLTEHGWLLSPFFGVFRCSGHEKQPCNSCNL